MRYAESAYSTEFSSGLIEFDRNWQGIFVTALTFLLDQAIFICKVCSFSQAIAMVFTDMGKERNFISTCNSTCAFVLILLYVLCQCVYMY